MNDEDMRDRGLDEFDLVDITSYLAGREQAHRVWLSCRALRDPLRLHRRLHAGVERPLWDRRLQHAKRAAGDEASGCRGYASHGMSRLALGAALAPVDHQQYLLEARQMQALSFAVHIPLVAFAISFPAMVLFVEWLGYRTGDELYLTLARSWSRIMLALFAVGVITGTVLSFEMGFLWPNFTGDLRQRVRARVRDRGLLVLHGGDLHRHLPLRLGAAVPSRALASAGSRS